MIIKENGIVRSDAGLMIRRVGGSSRFYQAVGDVADFEEVTEAVTEVDEGYAARVSALVRERYTVDDELAVLRQRDTKPSEFSEYFEFVEACKERARVTPPPVSPAEAGSHGDN